VSFAAITLCVASQRMFVVVYFVTTQSGKFWIHPRTRQAVDTSRSVDPITCWVVTSYSDVGY
jgi:hypothetical protein